MVKSTSGNNLIGGDEKVLKHIGPHNIMLQCRHLKNIWLTGVKNPLPYQYQLTIDTKIQVYWDVYEIGSDGKEFSFLA